MATADIAISSIEEAQTLVQESSECIAKARAEKTAIETFFKAYEDFSARTNTLPFDTRFSSYHEFLAQDLAEAKQRYQPHIDRINAYIEERVKQRELDVQQLQLNAHASSIVHRLPFEVLGNIFTTCVLSDLDAEPHLQAYCVPFTLSLVNRAWREAVLRTPTVWSKPWISVTTNSYYSPTRHGISEIEHARTWLERSGVTPLYLRLDWTCRANRYIYSDSEPETQQKQWAELIGSLNHRLIYFHHIGNIYADLKADIRSILIRDPFTRLTSFKFDGSTVNYAQKPEPLTLRGLSRLRTVSLQNPVHLVCETLEGLTALESLTIMGSNGSEGFASLLSLWLPPPVNSTLRSLTIEWYHHGMEPLIPVVELPGLVELRLQTHLGICVDVARKFSIPSLETLYIAGNAHNWKKTPETGKDTVTILFNEARFPCLRKFVLTDIKGVDEHLRKFLAAHGDLTSLTLNNVPCAKTFALLLKYPAKNPPLCPRIQKMDLAGFIKGQTVDDVIQMRVEDAQPAETYSDATRKFTRLVSLIWDGQEMLPLVDEVDCLEGSNGSNAAKDASTQLLETQRVDSESDDDHGE